MSFFIEIGVKTERQYGNTKTITTRLEEKLAYKEIKNDDKWHGNEDIS